MSNQLTPMQELINELEDTAKLSTNPIVTTTINLVIDIVNSKLPKEQQVIEGNNNGWIRIENENDLPKNSDDVEFFVVINNVVSTRVFYKGKFVNDYQLNIEEYDDLKYQPTHYQQIIYPKKPIF